MECPNCGGDVYDEVIEYDCHFCGEEVGEVFTVVKIATLLYMRMVNPENVIIAKMMEIHPEIGQV